MSAPWEGPTRRQWFAAQAMPIAGEIVSWEHDRYGQRREIGIAGPRFCKDVARLSLMLADAMIAAEDAEKK